MDDNKDQNKDSKPKNIPEHEMQFHYSRSHRLESASENVRKLNTEGGKYRFSLTRPLTATKPLSILFISIVALSAIGYFVSMISGVRNETAFGGNALKMTAFTFEGKTYLTIKKTMKNKDTAYTGAVDIAISPKEDRRETDAGKIDIKTERLFFSLSPEEDFKLSIPFEADDLVILMQSEKEIRKLYVKTK